MTDPSDPLPGIPVFSHRVERTLVRARDVEHTFSAWALAVETEQGSGRIVRIELTPDAMLWRGDGVFLGWTPGRLEAAWTALRAAEPEADPEPDGPQLG